MSITTNLLGTIPAVVGRPGERIEGTDSGEWIIGTDDDDVIAALGGDDFVQGFAGADVIAAGAGNDTVLGGEGDEIIIAGGTGDDVLRGDAGADIFGFNPSGEEGADVIVDFTPEDGDVIALSAVGLASAGLDEFSGAALDESEAFNIVEDAETGDLVIEHAGGTVTLNGVPFAEEGQEPPTFAELEAAGLLTIARLVQGTDGGEELTGTELAEVIDAGDGDDTITPLGGDDIITTGGGSDSVNLDPSNAAAVPVLGVNPDEGNDLITDFSVPSGLDATEGDTINFALEDVLAADPDLPAADGDATTLSLADFDSSENWGLDSSEDGNALLTHPNGSVELADVAAADLEFADLITIDGEELSEPIPVDDSTDGDDVADGDDDADGDDAADGDDGTDGDDSTDGDGAEGDDGPVDDGTDGDDVADGDDDADGDDAADGDDGTDGDDSTDDDGTEGDDGTDGDDDVAGDEDSADGEEETAQAASADLMEETVA